ncbi:hypothetical protein ACKFR3_08865 [Corynebacterium marquesiae]
MFLRERLEFLVIDQEKHNVGFGDGLDEAGEGDVVEVFEALGRT